MFGTKNCVLVAIIACFYFMSTPNNSCNNYWNYLNIGFSNNCYHIPDMHNNVTEIIKRHIGHYEQHQVETEDGYLLTIFRIPRENPKDVIYLHHPTCFDATIWVAQYKDSIAFKFWEKGFDVWLGNARGTRYSKKHKFLSPEDGQFWNYSHHELGYFDNFAAINYIKTVTNKPKIIYLGYSLGANAGILYAITRPHTAAASLKIVVSLAPAIYTSHIENFLAFIEPVVLKLMAWDEYRGQYTTIAAHNSWHMRAWRFFHYYFPFKKYILFLFNPVVGFVWNELDPNYANLMLMLMGSETSLKSIYHGYQLHKSGSRFRWYDYGEETNLIVYRNTTPPLYNIQDIKVPIYIVHSEDDGFSHPEDVEELYSELPKSVKMFGKLKVRGMSHNDFAFGRHRMEKVYNKVIDILDSL